MHTFSFKFQKAFGVIQIVRPFAVASADYGKSLPGKIIFDNRTVFPARHTEYGVIIVLRSIIAQQVKSAAHVLRRLRHGDRKRNHIVDVFYFEK